MNSDPNFAAFATYEVILAGFSLCVLGATVWVRYRERARKKDQPPAESASRFPQPPGETYTEVAEYDVTLKGTLPVTITRRRLAGAGR